MNRLTIITSFGKIIGFFLLMVFTLQVTVVPCYGDDVSFETYGTQGEHQIKAGDSDNKDVFDSSSVALDYCQCPCHLSLSPVPDASGVSCLLTSTSLNIGDHGFVQTISTDIFQPPQIIL